MACLHTRRYHLAVAADPDTNDTGKFSAFSRTVVAVDNARRGNLWTYKWELRNRWLTGT